MPTDYRDDLRALIERRHEEYPEITQSLLARHLGVQPETLYNVFAKRRNLSIGHLIKACELLGGNVRIELNEAPLAEIAAAPKPEPPVFGRELSDEEFWRMDDDNRTD